MYETLTLSAATRKVNYNPQLDFISLSCTPHDEPCTQAGQELTDQVKECTAYINQLKRLYQNLPNGISFFILENHHDYGIYFEAAVFFETSIPDELTGISEVDIPTQEVLEYLNLVEAGAAKWDEAAITELRIVQHTKFLPAKVIQMKTA